MPTTIHILLDGRVTASGRDGAPSTIEAPLALGFVEALAGLPTPETIRTSGRAVTLALTVEELRTLLADNTDLVRASSPHSPNACTSSIALSIRLTMYRSWSSSQPAA